MIKDIHERYLKDFSFQRSAAIKAHLKGNVEENLKVQANTPVCKECA
jgi:hypothetical protein